MEIVIASLADLASAFDHMARTAEAAPARTQGERREAAARAAAFREAAGIARAAKLKPLS